MACHVGLYSTSTNQRLTRVICATWQSGPCARRTFPGCCVNPPTHRPAHHPPPTRVFLGSSPGVRRFHGCCGKFPGRSRTFRVFLGSSGCVWEVPGMFGKFPGCVSEVPGCFREVPRVFWEVPVRFRKFPGVLESCRVLGPKKHVLRSFVCKKIRSKAKTRNFRPMFHAEPAGIRSWSSEPVVIRSRRLAEIQTSIAIIYKIR